MNYGRNEYNLDTLQVEAQNVCSLGTCLLFVILLYCNSRIVPSSTLSQEKFVSALFNSRTCIHYPLRPSLRLSLRSPFLGN